MYVYVCMYVCVCVCVACIYVSMYASQQNDITCSNAVILHMLSLLDFSKPPLPPPHFPPVKSPSFLGPMAGPPPALLASVTI